VKTVTLDDKYVAAWQARWNALHVERFANDYEVARLCHELRNEFPEGDAGDAKFHAWVKPRLRNGARADLIIDRYRAFREFEEYAWKRLGGWPGITFLMGLSLKQRYRLIDTFHGPGPFHRNTLRRRAIKLGISTKRKTRDNRAQSEARVDVLRRYIATMHKQHPELGELPEPVRKAMTPGMLSALGLTGARAS